MEELWRETSELLLQRPILWVPVLVADLLSFLVSLGSNAMVRSVVLGRLQYQSALGGVPVRASLSPSAMQHAATLAMLITWPGNFLRILLYALALVATAALASGFVRRARKPEETLAAAMLRSLAGVFALTFRAFALYALFTLLLEWVGRFLLSHGHRAVLTSAWTEVGAGVILCALLAWVVAPSAARLLAHRALGSSRKQQAIVFAFVLGTVSLLLARFVAGNLRAVHIVSAPARLLLGLTGSWIAALPFAALFVALMWIAHKSDHETEVVPEEIAAD